MLFSVIIPTYNRAALLREALNSVFVQTYTDYEVIVVDDGSTDETVAVAENFGGRIRFFQQQNAGPGVARNLGIKNALGDYITFLDSDDLWFPWTLETYQKAIASAAKPTFVSGREVKIKNNQDMAVISPGNTVLQNYSDYLASSSESIWIGTCSVAINSKLLREAGAFHGEHANAEDSDLWLRMGTAPGYVHIKSPPVFGHRISPGSEVTNQDRTFRGLLILLDEEQLGRYPGGRTRRIDRWRILARHIRPGSINLIRQNYFTAAMTLYFRSFWMQCALRRFKYLAAFWLMLFKQIATRAGA